MKRIPITVYILDTPPGYGPDWYVETEEEDGRQFGHSELGQAIAMAVQHAFQKKVMKAMGQ